ncbi:ABC transporter permease [Actinotalea solisilvae]|uniref:ABC transporter permease n=1 Tax=Actinotalea solisilvae TaxID=2072922 RepID=UPI0018F1BC59|nr:ABC transporter permease [Actinotalea solisilvae]
MSAATGDVLDRRPRGTARLLGDQLRHTATELWRARVVLVFTVLLPVVWLVVIGFLAGDATLDGPDGPRVMQVVTPAAVAMGVLFACFPTVAIALAGARERGTLKRVRTTPLPVAVFLAGRVGGAAAYALVAVAATLGLAVVAYDVRLVGRTLLATVVTLVLAALCFAALGVAVAVLAPSTALAQAASIAAAVVLTFASGLFSVGGELPDWLERLGRVLPLEPFATALRHQLDPSRPGSGWDPRALAVVGAWGLAGALVAVLRFDREPRPPRRAAVADAGRGGAATRPTAGPAGVPSPGGVATRATAGPAGVPSPGPVETGRPGPLRLVADQARAADRSTWRDPGTVFFTLAMPVGLYALMVSMQGPRSATPSGVPLAVSFAAGMVTWGVAVAAFMNLPEAVASARDRGVLARLRTTPLRPWHHLAGRAAASLWLVAVIAALVLVTARLAFDAGPTAAGLLVGALVLVLGTLSLAACGFAVAAPAPSAQAVGAVGLAVLLPLSFFSDVFVTDVPSWMSTVGSLFPLQHLQHALVAAWDPAGTAVPWGDLLVLAAWAVAAGAFAVRTFRWERRASG